ncbi:Rne/Rng family ribonuclease [Flexivirga oryzae]|uniref:Ribonuclease E n=1 Tax=Flexivirga oryzae TaxID=1794944 RepID=A0A839N6S5_9MICO|nr:Rne/Rng family ribonuclease [Flexivirga oryzae]MBB2890915.1 ribonuclease E [Flexivirga oryzae]
MAPQDSTPFLAPASGDADPAADEGATTSPTSAAMNFGLLFQAPDLEARAPRREPEQADEPDEAPASTSDGDADNDAQGGTRSRRRGGRGRRAKDDADNADAPKDEAPKDKAKGSDNQKSDTPSDAEDSSDKADKSDDSDGSDQSEGSGRRRTRRRRRSGGATDGDDPPNTVTKVREPRKERDEVTAIKGSTRLEAKKQRRREGREAGRRRTVITEAEFLARRESVDRQMVVRERGGRIQIGVLEDGVLVEHYVSREVQQASMAGNVYLGKVQNVLPSMEAAFVDIGRGRNAVLYAGEVNWDAAGLENGQAKRIENALSGGDTVLVQVTKDPIGHKGARLTSQVSLPGRFLVYVPGNSMTGISRKLPDTERSRLKKILKEVVPSDAGVIVRTAAEGASEEDLRADVERLQAQWEKIQADATSASAPSLLHGEPDLTVRVIRDVFNEDFSKLVVSGDHAWSQVHDYVSSVAPDLAPRLEKWTGETDVFSVHRIDEQLAKAMDRKVWLPSGGSLIIDRTEAMTVIDVNTGKFVGSGGNLEETVTKNNLEAAEEIVRQLRLRDIGGIIVVDFIDMVLESNRDLVVRRLLECLGRDRTKHQVAEVTSLGLVQMTRKRVGSGLVEVFSEPCEHCGGRGIIIHSEPVDKPSGGGSGGGGGKSRKGRGKKTAEEPPKPSSGPTAAQIAAAAHAAAQAPAKSHEATDEAVETSDGPVAERTDTADTTLTTETAPTPDTDPATGAAPVVTGRAGSQRPGSDASDSEQDDANDAAAADEPVAQPEPAGRKLTGRARRRATSAAGAAQHIDVPVAAPVTTVASEGSQVVAGTDTGDAEVVAAEPVKPKRKKRARVVAPAGPPVADGE